VARCVLFMDLKVVTSTEDLDGICRAYADAPYVTVDTEFMRERTYWPVLCLVQLGRPRFEGESSADWERDGAVIVDPMADDISLEPLFDLMADKSVLKVFHAARQDVEIFHNLAGAVPAPLYDTQVAAMVCGFGDQVGYETLVRKIVNASLDKSSRFTDWSRRPLSAKQLNYALGDVTHLRQIYDTLSQRVAQAGRCAWVAEEMNILTNPATYITEPEDAWKRLKMRNPTAKLFVAAQALAGWREREAQRRNVPRNRIIKDDALMELAASRPKDLESLSKSRLLTRENRNGDAAKSIIDTLAQTKDGNTLEPLKPKDSVRPTPGQSAVAELLRTLLRAKSADADVAARLIASSADLDRLAVENEPADLPALNGWRREVFGEDALRLKAGEIALSAGSEGVKVVDLK